MNSQGWLFRALGAKRAASMACRIRLSGGGCYLNLLMLLLALRNSIRASGVQPPVLTHAMYPVLYISFHFSKQYSGRVASGPEVKPLGVRWGEKMEMLEALILFPGCTADRALLRGFRADIRVAAHGAYPHFALYGHVLAFVDVLLRLRVELCVDLLCLQRPRE